jgi:hypothetical protein
MKNQSRNMVPRIGKTSEGRKPRDPLGYQAAFIPRLENVPQIVSRIHWHEGMSPEELDEIVSKELLDIWFCFLSDEERYPGSDLTSEERNKIGLAVLSRFDAIILRQAETLGSRLLASTVVRERIRCWDNEPNGPALSQELGKAQAKALRIAQGRELPPIDDPDLVPTQTQTTSDLKNVLHDMKKVFAEGRNRADEASLLQYFVKSISDSAATYPTLSSNRLHWQRFLEENPGLLEGEIFRKRSSPATLFFEWLSFCKGHKPETLRKKISSLRRMLATRQLNPELVHCNAV